MTGVERMDVGRCRNELQRNHLRYIEETGVSILSFSPRVGDDGPLCRPWQRESFVELQLILSSYPVLGIQ